MVKTQKQRSQGYMDSWDESDCSQGEITPRSFVEAAPKLEVPPGRLPNPSPKGEEFAEYAPEFRLDNCENYSECLNRMAMMKTPNGRGASTWVCSSCKVPKHYGVDLGSLHHKRVKKNCIDCDLEFEVSLKNYSLKVRCSDCRLDHATKVTCPGCGGVKTTGYSLCYACAPKKRRKAPCKECGATIIIHPSRMVDTLRLCKKCKGKRAYTKTKEVPCNECGKSIKKRTSRSYNVKSLCVDCYYKEKSANKSKVPRGKDLCECGKFKTSKSKRCADCANLASRQGMGRVVDLSCKFCGKGFKLPYGDFYRRTKTRGLKKKDLCCGISCARKLVAKKKRGKPMKIDLICAKIHCMKLFTTETTKAEKRVLEGRAVFCSRGCGVAQRTGKVRPGWMEYAKKELAGASFT